ncbi:unnamed protein product [Urochloa decumbens]|uniref:Uncharacterized protein n=1 Tax=Urochloa decumbens TaxID=240449 RepID=A0ABC9C319_9POAL
MDGDGISLVKGSLVSSSGKKLTKLYKNCKTQVWSFYRMEQRIRGHFSEAQCFVVILTKLVDFVINIPKISIFGWTYDCETFNLHGLNDYQRIVPTRVDFYEYPQYDAYRFTFSDHRTDKEYVKYYNEISKKIKWVEEYMRRDKQEFELKFERTSHKQSMMIAKGFPHLTMALAKRGYEEYLLDLAWKLDTQDYVRVYFEVWDRVFCKNEMSFEDALKSALPVFGYSCNCRIVGQLLRYHNLMLEESMHGSNPRGYKDEILMHITDAVYKIKSAERPKLYLDYVKKKIEVAQRLQLSDESIFHIGRD